MNSNKIPVIKSSPNNFLRKTFSPLAKLYTSKTCEGKKASVGDNSRDNALRLKGYSTLLLGQQKSDTDYRVSLLYMFFDLSIACSLVKRGKKHENVVIPIKRNFLKKSQKLIPSTKKQSFT